MMMMTTHSHAKDQSEIAPNKESIVPELERLAGCGFTAEEIVSLLRLRQWYQTEGSDRVTLMHHWEFLKYLVLKGKLEV